MGKIGVGIGEEFPVEEPVPKAEQQNQEQKHEGERGSYHGWCGSHDWRERQWHAHGREWREHWREQREEWRRRFGPSHFWLLPALAIVLLVSLLLWGLLSAIFQHPFVFVGSIVLILLFIAHMRYHWHDHAYAHGTPRNDSSVPPLPPTTTDRK